MEEDIAKVSCYAILDTSKLKADSINIMFRTAVFNHCGERATGDVRLFFTDGAIGTTKIEDGVWLHFSDPGILGKVSGHVDSSHFELDLDAMADRWGFKQGMGYSIFFRETPEHDIEPLVQSYLGDCNDLFISGDGTKLMNIPEAPFCGT
jgi:hypothetical protein